MNQFTFFAVVAVVILNANGILTLPTVTVVNVENIQGNFKKVDITSTTNANGGQEIMASYYVSDFLATWDEANAACGTVLNKTFVSIQNAAKNEEVKEALVVAGAPIAWISGRFSPSDDAFLWAGTGRKFTYSNWLEGDYNHDFRTYPCIYMEKNAGKWATWLCTISAATRFVCE